mmetsp:Transcript_65830/g.132224  ORF Transcript_65830/g.132224 Transcript_65830/m.132224 type:complete len:267 (+) Transcript_65830:492-1292(+)
MRRLVPRVELDHPGGDQHPLASVRCPSHLRDPGRLQRLEQPGELQARPVVARQGPRHPHEGRQHLEGGPRRLQRRADLRQTRAVGHQHGVHRGRRWHAARVPPPLRGSPEEEPLHQHRRRAQVHRQRRPLLRQDLRLRFGRRHRLGGHEERLGGGDELRQGRRHREAHGPRRRLCCDARRLGRDDRGLGDDSGGEGQDGGRSRPRRPHLGAQELHAHRRRGGRRSGVRGHRAEGRDGAHHLRRHRHPPPRRDQRPPQAEGRQELLH